jgi:uncharacterized protein (TIGR03437 family)
MNVRLAVLLTVPLVVEAQTVDVGSGAPNTVITQQFVNAFFRNNFSNIVSLPPTGQVRKFGSTGLIQDFQDAAKTSGVRLALVKANTSTTSVQGVPDVVQVLALMYDLYNATGVGTAGYPTMDTALCPNAVPGTCYWQAFDKSYALFAYSAALANGSSTFTTKEPFYSVWNNGGGVSTFGPAITAEAAITSAAGTAGTYQSFQNGMVINITSGTLSGRVVSVTNPVYPLYIANGGPSGFLGFPLGAVQIVGAKRRQNFEGGSIEYEPGGPAVLRLPVSTLSLSPTLKVLQLKLNETFTVEAIPQAANGEVLSDRVISWTTTNGRVVSIQASGRSAVIKAIGGGVATVTAVSEGKISPGVNISVQTPCCAIGEGAPTAAAGQSFADAVARNRLNLQLPAALPVRRSGAGYFQEFTTASGARLVIALADRASQAWVLTGPILTRYEEIGAFTGALGYPVSDATPGGRQSFENGALAGTPVQLVSGLILTRWAQLGFETGIAGPPVSGATPFSTFAASGGITQTFRNGLIVNVQSGALPNRTHLVTGAILRRYQSLGGVEGGYGSPLNEEFTSAGRRRQDFEGGYFTYAAGSEDVEAVQNERKPSISVLPSTPVAGSRIRIAVGGFPDNARLQVSLTGQPDFRVQTRNGAYLWDAWIPANSPSRTITVRALDPVSRQTAQATYTIRSAAEIQARMVKVRGDAQAGAPGTRLPIPLRVSVRDENGNALSGVAVTFTPSPGAELIPRVVNTDLQGEAETLFQLPAGEGVALARAEAARQVVTFSARATGTAVSNFPRLTFDGNTYAGSAAAILKYFQDRGELGAANGIVTPAAIDTYLRNICVTDNQANQICDGYLSNPEVPNVWRLISFAGGTLEIVTLEPSDAVIRESLAAGSPVLLSLQLPGGAAAGVVAVGVDGSGDLELMDPSPRQPQTRLSEYRAVGARLTGAARFIPRAPASAGFLFTALGASATVAAPAGLCGAPFMVGSDTTTASFTYCDGTQAMYQAEVNATGVYRGTLTDLSPGGGRIEFNGSRSGYFQVQRPGLAWELAPLEVSLSASSILNAASFNPDLAPGAIVSIFGVGLGRQGAATNVEVAGLPARVLFATPFQVNAALPVELPAGSALLRVVSPFGIAESPVEIKEVAPAIFRLSATQAAVTNQDHSLNTPGNPAVRGQAIVLYGTGFGAVQGEPGSSLRPAASRVTASVAGVDVRVVYAGLTPGAFGLYQVNIELPVDVPPGLFQSLLLRQGGVALSAVSVAIH